MQGRGRHPGHQVEPQKTRTARLVFDIAPVDPKNQHIAGEMGEIRVQKHRREEIKQTPVPGPESKLEDEKVVGGGLGDHLSDDLPEFRQG